MTEPTRFPDDLEWAHLERTIRGALRRAGTSEHTITWVCDYLRRRHQLLRWPTSVERTGEPDADIRQLIALAKDREHNWVGIVLALARELYRYEGTEPSDGPPRAA